MHVSCLEQCISAVLSAEISNYGKLSKEFKSYVNTNKYLNILKRLLGLSSFQCRAFFRELCIVLPTVRFLIHPWIVFPPWMQTEQAPRIKSSWTLTGSILLSALHKQNDKSRACHFGCLGMKRVVRVIWLLGTEVRTVDQYFKLKPNETNT